MGKDKREVSIHLRSRQIDAGKTEMFSGIIEEFGESVDFSNIFKDAECAEDVLEIRSTGTLTRKNGRLILSYEETELTGMEGATTTVSFAERDPSVITMLRYGSVSTALVFEEGKRHICAYDTHIMPFEICIQARTVRNHLTFEGGTLDLDYLVEIRGAKAERTAFSMTVKVTDDNTEEQDAFS